MAGSTMLQEFKNEPLDAPWPVPSRQPLSSPSTGPRSTAPVLAAVAPTVGFRLDSEQTAALHRHIPALAETVREIVRQGQPAQLMIDLSELAPAPFYQELACLCAVLRRILGPRTPIVLAGANPAVAWSLQSGYLPEGVTIVTTRRHRHPTR